MNEYDTLDTPFIDSSADAINAELDRMLATQAPQEQHEQPPQTTAPQNDVLRDFVAEERARREADMQARRELEQRQAEENYRRSLEQTSQEVVSKFRPSFHYEVPEDVRNVYKDADPYVRSVVAEMLNSMWDNNLQPMAQNLIQGQAELATRQPAAAGLSVDDRVMIAKPNMQQLVTEPQFQNFLSEYVDGTGMTRRDIMDVAYRSGNTNSIVSLLNDYEGKRNGSRQQRGVTPSSNVNAVPSGDARAPRRRSISELNNARRDFRTGKITRENLGAIETMFEDLAARNLVDMNS